MDLLLVIGLAINIAAGQSDQMLSHSADTKKGSEKRVIVVFETSLGKFEVAVNVERAPITAANFLKYVNEGSYNNGIFHRTVRPDTESRTDYPIQVVQASSAKGSKQYPAIVLERTRVTGIRHIAGTVSMARSTADTAISDFFICIADAPELDFGGKRNADGQGFAAFGYVVSGMEVVKKIQAAPTKLNANGKPGQTLSPSVQIVKAYQKK